MKNLRKIILAVAALGTILAIFLVYLKIFYLEPRLERVQREENKARSPMAEMDSRDATVSASSPIPDMPGSSESGNESDESMLFSEDDPYPSPTSFDYSFEEEAGLLADVNEEATEQLLRDHVRSIHPQLKLSDQEFRQLAKSITMFRKASERKRSMERTSANAAFIRESIQETVAAMNEFRQITGMTPDEFFMEDDPPVIFGNADYPVEDDDEIVTETLSDHNP